MEVFFIRFTIESRLFKVSYSGLGPQISHMANPNISRIEINTSGICVTITGLYADIGAGQTKVDIDVSMGRTIVISIQKPYIPVPKLVIPTEDTTPPPRADSPRPATTPINWELAV